MGEEMLARVACYSSAGKLESEWVKPVSLVEGGTIQAVQLCSKAGCGDDSRKASVKL